MEVLSAEPFEVVADFTMYCIDLNSSPNKTWFYELVNLTPKEIYGNITTVYALNANLDVCRYLKRDIPKSVKEFVSKFQFLTSGSEIYRYIHPKELHLPESEGEEKNMVHFANLASVIKVSNIGLSLPSLFMKIIKRN